jgi:hypothetical protein
MWDVGCEIGRERVKARNARKVKLTTETQRTQRKNHHGGTAKEFRIANCEFKSKKTELTADPRRQAQTKIAFRK